MEIHLHINEKELATQVAQELLRLATDPKTNPFKEEIRQELYKGGLSKKLEAMLEKACLEQAAQKASDFFWFNSDSLLREMHKALRGFAVSYFNEHLKSEADALIAKMKDLWKKE